MSKQTFTGLTSAFLLNDKKSNITKAQMDNLGKFGSISQGRIGFRVIIFFSFIPDLGLNWQLYLMKSKIQACSKEFSEG